MVFGNLAFSWRKRPASELEEPVAKMARSDCMLSIDAAFGTFPMPSRAWKRLPCEKARDDRDEEMPLAHSPTVPSYGGDDRWAQASDYNYAF
jgi:hypothetical protein